MPTSISMWPGHCSVEASMECEQGRVLLGAEEHCQLTFRAVQQALEGQVQEALNSLAGKVLLVQQTQPHPGSEGFYRQCPLICCTVLHSHIQPA